MGCNDDRCSEPMQFNEEPQKSTREPGIDVSGRLIGEKQFRAHNERPRDRGPLLFAAG